MDYNSDDLASEPEFSEELLDDEELDQLMTAFPVLKSKLGAFKPSISDIVIKECLYDNYFDISQSFEDLKADYKLKEITKKITENFTKPSPDDKVLNANKQALNDLKNLDINDKPKKVKKTKEIDIRKELEAIESKIKPNKWFVVIGHVDSGKSTLVGRLLLDTKAVDLNTVEKLRKESEKIGKGSFALAWLTDSTSEERNRGVTTDIAIAEFETDNARLTAIDAPGHKDFVPQLINGVCQADTALVIIDSTTGEFEAGFQNDGQTKEHIIIAKSFGIKRIGVIINKMDKEQWSRDRFEYIKEELSEYLIGEVGFESGDITWIPASGLTGENVTKPNNFKIDGVSCSTVLDFVENGTVVDIDEIVKQPFNFQINDINDINNNEFSVVGRVLSGAIGVSQAVKILPIEEEFTISKIKFKDAASTTAYVDEVFELFFSKKQLKDKNFSDITADYAVSNDPTVKPSNSFVCTLNLFTISKPLLIGSPVIVFRNNSKISCKLAAIIQTGGKTKAKKHLISNTQATVKFTIDDGLMLPMSTFEDNIKFGKVVIRRFGATIGAGTIVQVE